jgi:hypothetical protein
MQLRQLKKDASGAGGSGISERRHGYPIDEYAITYRIWYCNVLILGIGKAENGVVLTMRQMLLLPYSPFVRLYGNPATPGCHYRVCSNGSMSSYT